MNPMRHYWLEKAQVQLATALGVFCAYFAFWPLVRCGDPGQPLSFLVDCPLGNLAAFAMLFWLLAAICAVVTISGPPQGAAAALLIGTMGLSMRSAQIRELLWTFLERPGVLYGRLIVEIVILTAVLAVALIVIQLVRRAMEALMPALAWKDPFTDLPDTAGARHVFDRHSGKWLISAFLGASATHAARTSDGPDSRTGRPVADVSPTKRSTLQQAALCLVCEFVIAAVLLWVLMRSPDRGQILFAVGMSFFLAAFVANHQFPSPFGGLGWLLPMVLAICCYCLGATSTIAQPPQGWIEVRLYARVLPIDWLTAGCGGAMLGFWANLRTRQARVIEAEQEAREKAAKQAQQN